VNVIPMINSSFTKNIFYMNRKYFSSLLFLFLISYSTQAQTTKPKLVVGIV